MAHVELVLLCGQDRLEVYMAWDGFSELQCTAQSVRVMLTLDGFGTSVIKMVYTRLNSRGQVLRCFASARQIHSVE